MMVAKYYVGTSGWHYEYWREVFYPRDMAKSRWLEFYARSFSTVELNNTFYRLPSEQAFANWKNSTPREFLFSVKVSRFITHVKRLRNVTESMANFMARARLLEGKLGPLLYQLPPNMKRNDQTLEEFLRMLPEPADHVFEFRHSSWLDDGVFSLLHRYKAGFCIYDMPDFTTPVVATADFAYIRFHGKGWLYGGCYSAEELEDWARQIAALGAKVAYVYFNNDAEGFAVNNALMLKRLLEG